MNRLTRIFALAAPLALGACSTVPFADGTTCTTWEQNSLKIPLVTDSTYTSGREMSESCKIGKRIGYSALLGRKSDGTLHAASLVIWNKLYNEAAKNVAALPADANDRKSMLEAEAVRQVVYYADWFIQNGSNQQITSAKAKAMFDMKVTDPSLFTSDGLFAPPKPAEKICTGTGVFRQCNTPPAPPAAPDAAPQ